MESVAFIDANIFLEIFLKDQKSEECKNFLISAEKEKKIAITTDFIVYSCLIVAQNNRVKSIKDIVVFFNSLSNLNIIRPTLKDMYDACEVMEKNKLDFDDSMVVACAKNYGANELISLDKHFDKIKEIKRKEP